jgi:hypothetical protein
LFQRKQSKYIVQKSGEEKDDFRRKNKKKTCINKRFLDLRCATGSAQYQKVFQAIGTTCSIGDHVTTFNLPDFRGSTLVGTSQGPALTNRLLRQSFGGEQHTLSVSEMPAYLHDVIDQQHVHQMGNLTVGQV